MGNKKMIFKKLETLGPGQRCIFCLTSIVNEMKLGPIYMYQNLITHYYCLLLSSKMEQNGKDNEGLLGFFANDIRKEINRGKRLACTFCRKYGATLGCNVKECKVTFHLPCGIKQNTLHQFFGSFRSYCKQHRLNQAVPTDVLLAAAREDNTTCSICYEDIVPKPSCDTLWAPCCKKNAWFHRDCVQRFAISAGYFFKCPACNNKDEFNKSMRKFGIYIPEQDASWEVEPNAFEDLLQRHDHCNASKCLCPQGKNTNVTGTRWELVLCKSCGSRGMHIGCGKLVWVEPVWECMECKAVERARGTSISNNDAHYVRTNTHGPSYSSIHPSVSADREDDSFESIESRRRFVVHRQRFDLPSTSRTYVIPDSPEPYEKKVPSSSTIINVSDDEDDDDDVMVVNTNIPMKKNILTKEGREIPIVIINESSGPQPVIENVSIEIESYALAKRQKCSSVETSPFANTSAQSYSGLLDSSKPFLDSPAPVFPQELYRNTYVLESPQGISDFNFPRDTTFYQSVSLPHMESSQPQQLNLFLEEVIFKGLDKCFHFFVYIETLDNQSRYACLYL